MTLETILSACPLADYPKTSRVHRLKSFDTPSCTCFVKRDDELGFGISGSKVRKYLSLMPYILSEKPQEVVLIGSPFSNHVLSLSQLLVENGISPILFLVGEKPANKIGNFLLTSLIVEEEKMHFFPRSSWGNIEKIAQEYILKKQTENVRALAIPMGASMTQALPGALTLAEDILRNEKELGLSFDHLFIDAGTGMMAASLILAFAFLKKNTKIHVVQMAEGPEAFNRSLENWRREFGLIIKQPLTGSFCYELYHPQSAKAFGSINNEIFETIKEIARSEGFFTDPIYTAKLFQTGKDALKEKKIEGKALFIHSGGSLSLMGFQSSLLKKCSSLMEVNEIYRVKSCIN